jgi:uncharacterized protein (TIGR03382 family)
VAPPYARLTLLLEIAMGVGLLIGAWLARRRRFRQHAWCQSAIVLLNLAVIVLVMMPSFQVQVVPEIPLKLAKTYYALATAHAALGTITEIAGLYILLAAGTGVLPERIPHHQIQGLNANRTGTLVVRALVGIGNLRPLVRPAFPSEMKSRGLRSRASS